MNTRRKLVIRMANVRKINTRPQFGSPVFRAAASGHSGLRVAAYARVSTDLEEQSSSFEAQKDYYERLINETPGWTFAGIYADRGISGTSTDHRAGFQAMMEDCRAGKIDRILTKSVTLTNIEQLLEPDEIEVIWAELLSFYSSWSSSVENVCGTLTEDPLGGYVAEPALAPDGVIGDQNG